MNYKFYYYEDEETCFLSKYEEQSPLFDNINCDNSSIKISIKDKNVENMYNFFKENTIKQILSTNPQEIAIDYSEIETLPFYKDESFEKLIELIEQVKEKCNLAIKKFIEEIEEQKTTDAIADNVIEEIEEQNTTDANADDVIEK